MNRCVSHVGMGFAGLENQFVGSRAVKMNAVPKKKLCWNCEGNVSKEIDNCPYCGVYVHSTELEEETNTWNPSYHPSSSKTEEIPSPIYQIPQEQAEEIESSEDEQETSSQPAEDTFHWTQLMTQLKKDIFPLLFLMMGSIFFLFGFVLLLFSQNGTLTLQWQAGSAPYFLLFSLPLVAFGWWCLQKIESHQ